VSRHIQSPPAVPRPRSSSTRAWRCFTGFNRYEALRSFLKASELDPVPPLAFAGKGQFAEAGDEQVEFESLHPKLPRDMPWDTSKFGDVMESDGRGNLRPPGAITRRGCRQVAKGRRTGRRSGLRRAPRLVLSDPRIARRSLVAQRRRRSRRKRFPRRTAPQSQQRPHACRPAGKLESTEEGHGLRASRIRCRLERRRPRPASARP
jgi:hypothetical protein